MSRGAQERAHQRGVNRVTLRDLRIALLLLRANAFADAYRKQRAGDTESDHSYSSESAPEATDDGETTDVDALGSSSRVSACLRPALPLPRLEAPPRFQAEWTGSEGEGDDNHMSDEADGEAVHEGNDACDMSTSSSVGPMREEEHGSVESAFSAPAGD